MIHTVKIDDATVYGKHLLQNIMPYTNKTKSGVFIQNPISASETPEGYMTIEELRKVAIEDSRKFCQEMAIYM